MKLYTVTTQEPCVELFEIESQLFPSADEAKRFIDRRSGAQSWTFHDSHGPVWHAKNSKTSFDYVISEVEYEPPAVPVARGGALRLSSRNLAAATRASSALAGACVRCMTATTTEEQTSASEQAERAFDALISAVSPPPQWDLCHDEHGSYLEGDDIGRVFFGTCQKCAPEQDNKAGVRRVFNWLRDVLAGR